MLRTANRVGSDIAVAGKVRHISSPARLYEGGDVHCKAISHGEGFATLCFMRECGSGSSGVGLQKEAPVWWHKAIENDEVEAGGQELEDRNMKPRKRCLSTQFYRLS